MKESLKSIARMIDHSLLHPTLTDQELLAGCQLARKYDVAAVCIKPYAISLAEEALSGSGVKVASVVGFPHGCSRIEVKLKEAELAIHDGAAELDMVVNIGKVLSKDWSYISDEIQSLNELVQSRGVILKVIFENDFLPGDEFKSTLCHLCNTSKVGFVKTSTGYGFIRQLDGKYDYRGATDQDLILMRRECVDFIQVKAAGGIRTLDDILRVKALGVTRVGATATESILSEAIKRGYD